MARRRYYRSRSRLPVVRKGKTFRQGKKLVRYVYRGGKRIGIEIVRSWLKKEWKKDFERVYHRN